MRKQYNVIVKNFELFKNKIIQYGNNFEHFAFLDSHDYIKDNTEYTYYEYDFLAAIGSVKELTSSPENNFKDFDKFNKTTNDWIFGYLGYDLKNELENLESKNDDILNFPDIHFFIPNIIITSKNKQIIIHYTNNNTNTDIEKLLNTIHSINLDDNKIGTVNIQKRFSREEYLETVNKLKEHIQLGDIYEVNFCQEFYSNSKINPLASYFKLKNISPTPFSCFYKTKTNYLLSASPERYLKKTGTKLISQPIKGTIKRSQDVEEDENLKKKLLEDPKERAENVMIVDLVRNDLSKTAKKGTVKVEELYGIYSFKQVHQMISTVVSEVSKEQNIVDIIKSTFPMGSMTGAPKIRAMKLIDKYEKTKRGLYSGTVGYITPDKNFDFNVVIRSILYNESKKYVSFTVGGAITNMAKAELEYEECIIKAQAMNEVLK